AVTAARRREQQHMQAYLTHEGCLMEFLRRELDDPAAEPCGRCARCTGRPLVGVDVSHSLTVDAVAFLRGQSLTFEPRKQWPDGKRISVDQRAEPGRILSHYGNGGWGTVVQEQRSSGAYSDEVARALADLIAKQSFDPPVEWVTCVPSLRHPALVPRLAAAVAGQLGLPFLPLVAKAAEDGPQNEQDNSAQQYVNVHDA